MGRRKARLRKKRQSAESSAVEDKQTSKDINSPSYNEIEGDTEHLLAPLLTAALNSAQDDASSTQRGRNVSEVRPEPLVLESGTDKISRTQSQPVSLTALKNLSSSEEHLHPSAAVKVEPPRNASETSAIKEAQGDDVMHWDPVSTPVFRRERSLSQCSDGLTSTSNGLRSARSPPTPSSSASISSVALGTQNYAAHDQKASKDQPQEKGSTEAQNGTSTPLETALPEDDFIRYYVKGECPDAKGDDSPRVKFYDLLWQDLGVEPEGDQGISGKNASVEDDVFNFVRVPIEIEKVLIFGFFLCLDSMLFVIVYLPLRMARALALLVCTICLPKSFGLQFHRTQLYDLLRGIILIVAFQVVLWAPMSRVYHFVRGQTFIKLYAIFNMLDIFDRLMCSFGQDILDSLFYITKTSPRAYGRIGVRLVLGSVYAALHALLYFVRIVTLNVAINSTSNALLTILVSNNFVELKGNVFKRFAEQNLFQITCSDIVERFELAVFLVLTALQHTESWWDFMLGSAAYIGACELLVDWVKHAFITKFNRIPYSAYADETEVLCRDIAPVTQNKNPYADSQRQGGRPVDPTQSVAQRIGLATLPLTCVALRFIWANSPLKFQSDPFSPPNLTFIVLAFLCLLAFKSFLGIMLRGYACQVLMARERSILQRSSGRLVNLPTTLKEKELQKAAVATHMQKITALSGIRRYMIFKSRVPS
mmetsp:Transcript_17821/g.32881  ORF Transcript_17821/g.32881 Transcript_17821/m.32881 type:complete len:707 (+) Transcript_17821:199-2319(+)|eukprot:CAMPEP_0184530552 /NCGR_PEP_ID=MMETSP0198_2-20121128/13015_1 /TAXON_ID=1112570 /ORGANISM="Thraustochytrium sp., Strain LLF1b" /LENGTH=706 /DNA_ID=CAMNT_0026922731 /DNA_START=184 /DNA_END=2304 /DNA_ORIENTATION=-